MLDVRLTAAMSPTTPEEHARMAKLPYKTLVGSLGYLAMWTFPQISYATKELARFSANPGELHWKSLLRTVTYVKENRNWCIYLSASADINLYGYCDANYCGQPRTRFSRLRATLCSKAPRQFPTVQGLKRSSVEALPKANTSLSAPWCRRCCTCACSGTLCTTAAI